MAKVIEYCKFHTEAKAKETSEDDAKNFDTEFVKVDQATLFELILVRTAPRVRALGRARSRTGRDEISPLKRALFRALILFLSLAVRSAFADVSLSPRPSTRAPASGRELSQHQDPSRSDVHDGGEHDQGQDPEEIRKTFNIKNDFTPEEEEEVRRENQWAFE